MAHSSTSPETTSQQKLDALYRALQNGELTIGQAVKAMRKISGLRQPEFAKHRGVSLQTLKSIERDVGNPTVQTLQEIAKVFGLRVGFVMATPKPLD